MKITSDRMEIIVQFMDDELREQAHAELEPCTNEEFFARYCQLHHAKYGKEFLMFQIG